MEKRSNFSSFPQYFQYISIFRSQITYSFVKCGCSIYCFPHFCNSDISRYGYLDVFRESLGIRENGSRLYLYWFIWILTLCIYPKDTVSRLNLPFLRSCISRLCAKITQFSITSFEFIFALIFVVCSDFCICSWDLNEGAPVKIENT